MRLWCPSVLWHMVHSNNELWIYEYIERCTYTHSSMWLRLQTVSVLDRCPLFRVSFIERFHCTYSTYVRTYIHVLYTYVFPYPLQCYVHTYLHALQLTLSLTVPSPSPCLSLSLCSLSASMKGTRWATAFFITRADLITWHTSQKENCTTIVT